MVLNKGFCWGLVFVLFFCSSSSFAQNRGENLEIKRNVARVLFSTLGGAVLGLSTLSFYGEPQEHVDNITLGALLGLVAGSGYVVYKSTQNTNSGPLTEGYSWQDQQNKKVLADIARTQIFFQVSFSF